MAADRPQEALRVIKTQRFLGRQHILLDQLPYVVGAVDILGDPEQRVQISEPTLALLDVRLELVTAVADPLVPRVALRELAFDELRCSAAHDVRIKPALEISEERLFSPKIACLEQPGADRQIGFGLAQAFFDRACRVPDLEAKVP